jgi:LysM repeat protein
MIGVVVSLMVGSFVGTQVLARTQSNAANEIMPFVPTIFSVETPTPTSAPQSTATTVTKAQSVAVVVLPSPTPSATVQNMPTQVALPTKAVPTPSATIVVSKPTLKVLHVAKAGETCDAIAKRYNVSLEKLVQLNEFASGECKLSVDQLVVVANAPLDALPKTRITKPTRAPTQPPTATHAPIPTIAPELPTPQPATQLQPAPPVSPPTVQPQPTVCDAKNFASPCFLP